MQESKTIILPELFIKTNFLYSEWISRLPEIIKDISLSTGFKVDSLEGKSRFGLVLYGMYNGSDAVLKILPNDKKSHKEIEYLRNTRCPFVNQLLFFDNNYGYYIIPKGIALRDVSNEAVWGIFSKMLSCLEKRCNSLTDYYDSILERISNLNFYHDNNMCEMLLDSKRLYDEYFSGESLYMLHGDIRVDNMIDFQGEIRLIDPLGINAPLEFMFSRYMEDIIFGLSQTAFEQNLIKQLKCSCEIGMNETKVGVALLIDSVMRTSSSALRGESELIINQGIDNYIGIKNFFAV